MIVTLEKSFLRVIVKKNREKKATERIRETAAHHCDRKKKYFKTLLQMVFKITTRSSPTRLTVESHGILHAVEDS